MKKILTFTQINPKRKLDSVDSRKALKKTFLVKPKFSIQAPTVKQKVLAEPGSIAKKTLVCCDLENFRNNYLQKEKLQLEDSPILCTISSGQDSILTFFLLLHIKKTECLQILYCQHFWQTKNFFSARLLFKINYLVKVPYTISLPQKVSLTENDSRDWRKKTFCRFSKMENILTTITGHTETDGLEKNVNNLLRGTSPRGISKSLFLKSKKTVDLFFPIITQNTCLLTKKTLKIDLKKKDLLPNFENSSQKLLFLGAEEKKRTKFLVQGLGTGTGDSLFSNFKTKKTDQNCFKIDRLDQQRLILRTKFSFSTRSQKSVFGKIKVFSELENSTKKRIGNLKKIQLTSKSRKKGFDTINFGDFISQNRGSFGRKNFDFLKTKTSGSFLLSSKFCKLPINLINPLENISRFSVCSLINLYRFPLLIDITNFSYNFSRNKIRHQLFPFLRSLVHANFESLLTKFFKILSEQTKNLETDFEEVNFVYRLFKLRYSKSVRPFSNTSTKNFRNKICKKNLRFLIQKMFFDYKNISLNYYQISGLDKFY